MKSTNEAFYFIFTVIRGFLVVSETFKLASSTIFKFMWWSYHCVNCDWDYINTI